MNLVIGLSLLILFAVGVPIAISIMLASIIGIEFFSRLPLLMVPQQVFIGIDHFPLMAIPFFILAGNLMAAGGISARLVDLAKSIVGGLQGGLAMACVLTCMMFAAVSGSSVATTFAIGAILIPAMVNHGYPRPLAASIQASSAVAVFYALAVGGLLYGELRLVDLGPILRQSVISTATVMLIIAAAALFSFLISRSGLPREIAAWVTAVFDSPWAFLLAVNGLLLVVGMFIETSAAILVLAPILTPIAMQFGIQPVHFGLVMVVNLALGMITLPLGVNLFAACAVAKISIDQMLPWLLRFVLVILACLMAITYMPWISLGLVDLLY